MTNQAPPLKALLLWADQSAANLGLRVLASGGAMFAAKAASSGIVVDNQDFGPGDSTVSFGTRAILRDIGRRNGPIKSKLRQYDLLLDSGAGDSFTDIYGLKRLSFIAYAHFQARKLGLPLVLLPQTIGPFTTRIGRMIGRRTIRQAALVFSRDPKSSSYCEELSGRQVDFTATDLVFTLPLSEPDRQRDVIVNLSGLLWFGDEHIDSAKYRAQSLALIRQCIAGGRQVSLLAHVVRSPSGNDDIDAIEALLSENPDLRDSVETLIPDDLEAARVFLASARIVIGARMHACLNALSQGIPSIPWAYSRKFAPLLSAVGWDHTVRLGECEDPAATTWDLIRTGQVELTAQAKALSARAKGILDTAESLLGQRLRQVRSRDTRPAAVAREGS